MTSSREPVPVEIALTPTGRLAATPVPAEGAATPPAASRILDAFGRGAGAGLLHLGAAEVRTPLPPGPAWWRAFATRHVAAVCAAAPAADARATPAPPPPGADELAAMVEAAPPMPGAEYLDAPRLRALWDEMTRALTEGLAAAGGTLQAYLATFDDAWHVVGRVHFHLAENRRDPDAPFAFLATFTTRLGAEGRASHLPLGAAVRESAAAEDRDRLLTLLRPVQRAAEACPWIRDMVDAGDIFHPARWGPGEAIRFLNDVPRMEAAGLVVRVPATWAHGRPPRAVATAVVGSRAPRGLGVGALLDFEAGVAVDGEPLTPEEIEALLATSDGLALLRGRWVEVDRDRLRDSLERFRAAAAAARREGIPFVEAMRLLAGTETAAAGRAWAHAAAGDWLAATLESVREAARGAACDAPPPGLRATLRPYQAAGVRWLRLLGGLGLGACLADDMGLGKTVQVLALLLHAREAAATAREPSLIVAPASVLANWTAEAARFAPDLRLLVAHPSAIPAARLRAMTPEDVADTDVVLTTYGTLPRLPWAERVRWRHAVLDEAQAVKNPGTRQSRTVRAIQARSRIALTGTPVENRPGDLWALFAFLNPGLLGSAAAFTAFTRGLARSESPDWTPLRRLVRPYILRRMKTDPAVAPELPEKTEVRAWCLLARRQAALYAREVAALAASLRGSAGAARRGLILATILRLKQICNHPSQALGDAGWDEEDSGKLARLREVAETVAARQDKALVFTQFREATEPLAAFLAGVFGRGGLVLHGGTPVAKRKDIVRAFQEDDRVPFLVLSVRAGGTGLNLTAATHVVHFDRWWNPAVEEQATDRAFRIGQRRNVLVHKFVCRGTVEEKIDSIIEGKRALARDLVEGADGAALTELSDAEIMDLVALDLRTVAGEG